MSSTGFNFDFPLGNLFSERLGKIPGIGLGLFNQLLNFFYDFFIGFFESLKTTTSLNDFAANLG